MVLVEKQDRLRPYIVDVRGNVLVPDDDKQPVSVRVFSFAEAERLDLHVAIFLQQGLKQKSCKKVCTKNIFTTAVPRSRHTCLGTRIEK